MRPLLLNSTAYCGLVQFDVYIWDLQLAYKLGETQNSWTAPVSSA